MAKNEIESSTTRYQDRSSSMHYNRKNFKLTKKLKEIN